MQIFYFEFPPEINKLLGDEILPLPIEKRFLQRKVSVSLTVFPLSAYAKYLIFRLAINTQSLNFIEKPKKDWLPY